MMLLEVHYQSGIAFTKQKTVAKLFDELVEQFLGRNGGYTNIYKLALQDLEMRRRWL